MNSPEKEFGVDTEKKEKMIQEKEKKIEDFVNAIYQNLSTALQSIDEILKLSKSEEFNRVLEKQKLAYTVIKNDLLDHCLALGVKPKDNNIIEKARLWTSIKMTTIADKSTRHLAEMMLLGSVMGTLTCYKDLCDYKDGDKGLYELLQRLNILEETNFDELKKFLKENKC